MVSFKAKINYNPKTEHGMLGVVFFCYTPIIYEYEKI
jgi:hypothetical protein